MSRAQGRDVLYGEGVISTMGLHELDVGRENGVDALRGVGLVQSLGHDARTSYGRGVNWHRIEG